MQRKAYILIIVLLTLAGQLPLCGFANTQTQVDSLLAEYNTHESWQTTVEFFMALEQAGLIDESPVPSADTHKDTIRLNVYYWAAEYYYSQQRYEHAAEYALRALPLCHANSNSAAADCANLLSIIYVRLGKLDNAIQYAKMCYELDKKSGDPDRISSSLNTLTSIYFSAHRPKEAEKYVLEGIEYCKKAGNKRRLAVLYSTASEVYHSLEDNRKALDYAKKAYQLELELGRPEKAAMRQTQMALALLSTGQYRDARKELQEAIPVLEQSGNAHSLGIAYNYMGLSAYAEGHDSVAAEYYRKALGIFIDQHDLINESYSRKGLCDALRHIDPVEALLHYDRYQQLRDSIYDSGTNSTLSQYTVAYNTAQLEQRNKEQYLRFRNVIIAILILIVIVMVGAYFGMHFYNLHSQKKVDRLLNEIETLNGKINSETALSQRLDFDVSSLNPAHITAKGAEDSRMSADDSSHFIKQVTTLLEKDMSLAANVEALSDALSVTSQTLRRRLQAATGQSPKLFLQEVQLLKARRLLSSDERIPIGDIAQQCGFTESSSFARTFRRRYGITPSQYRQQAIMHKLQKERQEKAEAEKAKRNNATNITDGKIEHKQP